MRVVTVVVDGEIIGDEKFGLQCCTTPMFQKFDDGTGVDMSWLLYIMCDCEYQRRLW